VLILNEGRIAAQGSPEEIAGTMKGGDRWELTLAGADIGALPERLALLGGNAGGAGLEDNGDGTVSLGFFLGTGDAAATDGEAAEGARIFDWAVAQGYKILKMNRKRLSLEDIFVKLTNEGSDTDSTTNEGAGS
jgi:ABC-2 type transport system ATP-binding protein